MNTTWNNLPSLMMLRYLHIQPFSHFENSGKVATNTFLTAVFSSHGGQNLSHKKTNEKPLIQLSLNICNNIYNITVSQCLNPLQVNYILHMFAFNNPVGTLKYVHLKIHQEEHFW